jgi:hypothetical protein
MNTNKSKGLHSCSFVSIRGFLLSSLLGALGTLAGLALIMSMKLLPLFTEALRKNVCLRATFVRCVLKMTFFPSPARCAPERVLAQ